MTRSKHEISTIVKDCIKEFFLDEESINQLTQKITERIEQKIRKIEEDVKTQNDKIKSLEQKMDNLHLEMDKTKQRTKTNNICIYGVSEENDELLPNKIMNILKSKTEMDILANDILDAYRIGKRHENQTKPRPLILKIANQQLKMEILKCGKKFKGTKIFLTDELTKFRRSLLAKAKSEYGVKNAWSHNGQIYVKAGGTSKKITCMADLQR